MADASRFRYLLYELQFFKDPFSLGTPNKELQEDLKMTKNISEASNTSRKIGIVIGETTIYTIEMKIDIKLNNVGTKLTMDEENPEE